MNFDILYLKKFLVYGLGGGITLAMKVILTFILVSVFLIDYKVSYIIILILILTFSFYYNFYLTFNNKKNKLSKFKRYSISTIFFYLLDYILVLLFTEVIGLYYIISIIGINIFLFIIKFFVFNLIFRD